MEDFFLNNLGMTDLRMLHVRDLTDTVDTLHAT